MSNSLNPPGVIFLNHDISASALARIQEQLYITEVIEAVVFDARLLSDASYVLKAHGLDQRIMVLRNLHDLTNRNSADIVLCYKDGLLYVEHTKYGPPGKCMPLLIASLHELVN
jgi:hypothetical protein